jgi:hypothetical protein
MKACKLRSGVSWQQVLKQKRVKQTGIKQGLGVGMGFQKTFSSISILTMKWPSPGKTSHILCTM